MVHPSQVGKTWAGRQKEPGLHCPQLLSISRGMETATAEILLGRGEGSEGKEVPTCVQLPQPKGWKKADLTYKVLWSLAGLALDKLGKELARQSHRNRHCR